MQLSVFDFKNYKDYLKARLAGKGEKSNFAKHIGCQPSFLSQVLCGNPSLSLEQGVLANDCLGHSSAESQYFLALLQFERAGSVRLKQHFQTEINHALKEHWQVKERLAPWRELTPAARATYYSSWVYGAVHVLTAIPCADQIDFFLKRTGLQRDELNEVLKFLCQYGLVATNAEGTYRPTETRVHLPSSDPLVLNHHRNLRARALHEMQMPNEDNLHYSLLMAVAKSDGLKIREMILKMVESTDKIIRPSQEESAFQLNLDFFEL
ncbi:MAG: TIGR02147 family protein [Bdellovibrionales bacterium]|nr:TIGR02147 family protein [Bdellovibrionales bacterium]